MGKGTDKPDHVRAMASGGLVCEYCGGEVDEDGNSPGLEESGEEGQMDPDEPQDEELDRLWSKAVKSK